MIVLLLVAASTMPDVHSVSDLAMTAATAPSYTLNNTYGTRNGGRRKIVVPNHGSSDGSRLRKHASKIGSALQKLSPKKLFTRTSSKKQSASAVKPKMIYFLHLHKHGGTSMCAMATSIYRTVMRENCNVPSLYWQTGDIYAHNQIGSYFGRTLKGMVNSSAAVCSPPSFLSSSSSLHFNSCAQCAVNLTHARTSCVCFLYVHVVMWCYKKQKHTKKPHF